MKSRVSSKLQPDAQLVVFSIFKNFFLFFLAGGGDYYRSEIKLTLFKRRISANLSLTKHSQTPASLFLAPLFKPLSFFNGDKGIAERKKEIMQTSKQTNKQTKACVQVHNYSGGHLGVDGRGGGRAGLVSAFYRIPYFGRRLRTFGRTHLSPLTFPLWREEIAKKGESLSSCWIRNNKIKSKLASVGGKKAGNVVVRTGCHSCTQMASSGDQLQPAKERDELTGTAASQKASADEIALEQDRRRKRQLELLNKMPRYRTFGKPKSFPYYGVGHDTALSSLSGLLIRPATASTEVLVGSPLFRLDAGDQQLKLEELTAKEKSKLNFFYGGCGDCRHIYMTLYDLGQQLKKGNNDVRRGNRVHFLANDSSPAILARCAILLAGLHELAQFSMEDIATREKLEVNVLLALLHFVLLSPVVPSYVDEKLVEIIQRLLDNPAQYPSIRFANETWVGVKRVLEIWLSPTDQGYYQTSSAADLIENYSITEYTDHVQHIQSVYSTMSETFESCLTESYFNRAAQLGEGGEQTKIFGGLSDYIAMNLARLVNSTLRHLSVPGDLVSFAVHQVLPPPRELLSLHSPGVRRYYDMASREGGISGACDDRKLVEATSRYLLWLEEQNFKSVQVAEDYVANRTGREPVIDPELLELFPKKARQGHIPSHWDPLRFISHLYRSMVIEVPGKENLTLFDLSCILWEKAVYALKHLTSDSRSSVCFELSLGDMNMIARRMTLEPDDRTRNNLPTQFLRVFTSNVPDYTGLAYPLLDIIPTLLPSPKAFMRCNVMHSGIHIRELNEWLESVLVLNNAEEMTAMYGVVPLLGSSMRRFIGLGKTEEQIEHRKPLDEGMLATLLQRLLVGVAFPPPQETGGGHPRVFPETLVVFVELLGSLSQRGVNPRWIARAVEGMLEGKGKLTIPNPRPSKRVVDKDERSSVAIAPFLVELRTLLSLYQPVLNLDIHPEYPLPPDDTIALRSIKWPGKMSSRVHERVGLVLHPAEHRFGPRSRGRTLRRLALEFEAQDIGSADLGCVSVPQFFSVLHWSALSSTAQIYLAESDYRRMRQQGWLATLYSSVTYRALDSSIPL